MTLSDWGFLCEGLWTDFLQQSEGCDFIRASLSTRTADANVNSEVEVRERKQTIGFKHNGEGQQSPFKVKKLSENSQKQAQCMLQTQ